MKHVLRLMLMMLALVALASSWPSAQGGSAQNPPDAKPAAAAPAAADTQKPAEPAQELPADAKAFNVAAGEKNPMKRVEALEKFVADYPKSTQLVNAARGQITTSTLAAFKDSRAKYLAQIETEVADAKKRTDTTPIYSTYNNIASRLMSAGIFSEDAEDYARKGLAAMDEPTYMEMRKKQFERSLAAYEKAATARAAAPPAAAPPAAAPPAAAPPAPTPPAAAPPAAALPAPAPPAATPPAPAPPAEPRFRFVTKDGVTQVSLAPPAKPAPPRPPATPRPLVRPTMPTDAEIRTNLKSLRASPLATLGQILTKRGKADEGEKLLVEAYAAKPSSSTMATIARLLSESAKKAGNEKSQVEYLTVLALSGRITADETKEFEAVYRKVHNGSLDGLETMLDERFHRENVSFAVTPFVRKPPAKPTGRIVLAEVFPGAG